MSPDLDDILSKPWFRLQQHSSSRTRGGARQPQFPFWEPAHLHIHAKPSAPCQPVLAMAHGSCRPKCLEGTWMVKAVVDTFLWCHYHRWPNKIFRFLKRQKTWNTIVCLSLCTAFSDSIKYWTLPWNIDHSRKPIQECFCKTFLKKESM